MTSRSSPEPDSFTLLPAPVTDTVPNELFTLIQTRNHRDLGLVKDSNGMKMSKTKGNVVDPIDTMDSFGTDALRYTLVTGVTPGQDVPLSMERVQTNM